MSAPCSRQRPEFTAAELRRLDAGIREGVAIRDLAARFRIGTLLVERRMVELGVRRGRGTQARWAS